MFSQPFSNAFLSAGLCLLCSSALAQDYFAESDFFGEAPVVLTVSRMHKPLQESPASVSVIDREMIRNSGAREIADIFRMVPGMVVMAPSDEDELRHMLAAALAREDGPSAIRYPRGSAVGVPMEGDPRPLPLGKARVLRNGDQLALLALGSMVQPARKAAEILAKQGIAAELVDLRFVKPLDEELIVGLAARHELDEIAFPAISCGVYGYPLDEAAGIALREVAAFLSDDQRIEKVDLVVFGADDPIVLDRLDAAAPEPQHRVARGPEARVEVHQLAVHAHAHETLPTGCRCQFANHVFQLDDGAAVTTSVPKVNGDIAMSISVHREGQQISIVTEGKSQAWSVLRR